MIGLFVSAHVYSELVTCFNDIMHELVILSRSQNNCYCIKTYFYDLVSKKAFKKILLIPLAQSQMGGGVSGTKPLKYTDKLNRKFTRKTNFKASSKSSRGL